MTQAQLQQAGARRRQDQARSSSRRSEKAAQKNVAANQQKVDELQAKLKDADNRLFRATARLPDDEGDLRPGSLRLRGVARERRVERRRRRARVAEDEAKQLNELNLALREGRRPTRPTSRSSSASTPARSRRCRSRSTRCTPSRRGCSKRLDVIAPSVVKDYFRNAPLLDFMAPTHQGPADHPAERRRRRELHPRAEDGSLPDVPPGDRQEGLREISAAVHDASEPATCTSAAARRIRSTRSAARCATRAWGSRSASATRRTRRATRSRRKSGRRSTTGKSRTCGTTRCCRRR